jgi:cation transport ATPase
VDNTTSDAQVTQLRQIAVYVGRITVLLWVYWGLWIRFKESVAALKCMGVTFWMCTSDHQLTARAVTCQVGIAPHHICAGMTLEDKSDLVL